MRSTTLVRKAAIAQLCSTSDKLSNLAAVAKCAGMAKKAGASMLFLPECFGFIGESSKQTLQHSEPPVTIASDVDDLKEIDLDEKNQEMCHAMASIVSETFSSSDNSIENESALNNSTRFQPYESYSALLSLKLQFSNKDLKMKDIMDKAHENFAHDEWRILPALQTIARESGLWISAGGMHERVIQNRENFSNDDSNSQIDSSTFQKVFNTHIILNSSGDIITKYQKIHLFDVCIPSKNIKLQESASTVPGTKLVVCDTPLGRLGLSTCYDVRFPEIHMQLVKEGKADIIAVPSAFTVPTGKAHWHTLLKARAIENQCYIIAAAQYGRHNQKRESYGHALGVGPWGDILADAGADANGIGGVEIGAFPPKVVLCDIDLKEMESVRERMPIQHHRDSSSFSF